MDLGNNSPQFHYGTMENTGQRKIHPKPRSGRWSECEHRVIGPVAVRIAALFAGLWRHQLSECESTASLVDIDVLLGDETEALPTSCGKQGEVDEDEDGEESNHDRCKSNIFYVRMLYLSPFSIITVPYIHFKGGL